VSSLRDAAYGLMPDPVGELSFLLRAEGIASILGRFSECSGIAVERQVETFQEGGLNTFAHKLPTRLTYPNLVLKRGMTHESALLEWFMATQEPSSRGHVMIALLSPAGIPVRTWGFAEAYPVKWEGPSLNAGSGNAATETLEIAHTGIVVRI
jgi:phage tail-like protein